MQSMTSRFGIVGDGPRAAEALVELAAGLLRARGPIIDPVFFSTYAGLLAGCSAGLCDAVWAPPLVAQELRFTDMRTPVAVVAREGGAFYYSALVVGADSRGRAPGLHELRGKRVAWVSPRSAAGYVVPCLQLRALGYEPDTYFGSQQFYFTHERALRALELGDADVAATYAHIGRHGLVRLTHAREARIVMTAGPIPGDLVLAREGVEPALGRALIGSVFDEGGPLARVTGARSFQRVPERHFRAIERWSGLANAIGVLPPPRAVAHDVMVAG